MLSESMISSYLVRFSNGSYKEETLEFELISIVLDAYSNGTLYPRLLKMVNKECTRNAKLKSFVDGYCIKNKSEP